MPRIVFDTDLGIDDALALLYLLNSPEARIEAITTVHGNVPVETATANVFEVLDIAGVTERPPIARGSRTALTGAGPNAIDVHGNDGLGGWTQHGRVPLGDLLEISADELIVQLARKHPGELTLLLIGPATNAALAWRRDPEGFRQLKDIVAMSGAILEPGNTTAAAEFNAYADPEALAEVIASGVALTLVPLDVTRKAVLTREVVDRHLQGRTDRRAEFLRCITAQGFAFYRKHLAWEGMYLHDPLAAGVVLDPAVVETQRMELTIETQGEWTRGMTLAERRPWRKGNENATVSLQVRAELFVERFCQRVLRQKPI